jgi:hypothetical protein
MCVKWVAMTQLHFTKLPHTGLEATEQPVLRHLAAIQVTDLPRFSVKLFGSILAESGSNIDSDTGNHD